MNSGLNAEGPGVDEYETPPWLYAALDAEFGFDFDAAASADNALCKAWTGDIQTTAGEGGLDGRRIFCNPPYSQIDSFVNILSLSAAEVVVMLLPVRTDTHWFWLAQRTAKEIRFFRKRIRFHLGGKPCESPRFASMIVVFK